jgi:hypothetical protein
MPRTISQHTFLFQGFSIKTSLHQAYDVNVSVIHIFIKQYLITDDALCVVLQEVVGVALQVGLLSTTV